MGDDKYLGKYAKDLPPQLVEELIKKGYSVSPDSGRIRKRIRTKSRERGFSKRKLNKLAQKVGWVVLMILFLFSLSLILYHAGDKKKAFDKTR